MSATSMRTGAHPLALAVFAVVAAIAALVVVIALTGKPSDGDPVVSLRLAPIPEPQPMPPPAAEVAPEAELGPRLLNGNLVADPTLLEQSPGGPLPIISASGVKPMDAYARSFDVSDKRPRIAIVIGGLGLSAEVTRRALAALPPEITLSFAPYASDIQHWVDEARAAGHEVLVEAPMEPLGYPKNNPGPHTLMVRARPGENAERLTWTLSRFTGYVGVTNLLGGRFLGDRRALAPVLTALRERGLIFVDNGGAPHSVVSETAQRLNAPSIGAALVLDEVQKPVAIDARLFELENRARERRRAVGTGFLYPVTIQAVAQWAATLKSHGIALAPVSAMVRRADAPKRR